MNTTGTDTIRHAFYISDRTGITAEGLGEALLSRFDHLKFEERTYPFIDTVSKAHAIVEEVDALVEAGASRPLLFSSIVNSEVREAIHRCKGFHIDFFDTFIHPLEKELQVNATSEVGKLHGLTDTAKYDKRMAAINFALNHDDGITHKNLNEADIILIGVSRSGKTPTCLYLALHYGIAAANYPLTDSDLERPVLPSSLEPYEKKLFGLTIDPDRLHRIRSERRPGSRYAALDNCEREVKTAEKIFNNCNVPYLSSTRKSIEELAASILAQTSLRRQF